MHYFGAHLQSWGTDITDIIFKDLSLHYFQEYDPQTFLRLALLLQKYGNDYKVQGERNKEGGTDLSFYHDFGKKWSNLIGSLLHNELKRLDLEHSYEVTTRWFSDS